MEETRNKLGLHTALRVGFLVAVISVFSTGGLRAAEALSANGEQLVSILNGAAPSSIDELRAMEKRLRELSQTVRSATVAIQVDSAQGSGVIISPDGYVLTAAHVIGSSGRPARIYLNDGRRVVARPLGTFRTLDAGLLKIDQPLEEGESWPHVKVGDSSKVVLGQWCLAMGHPGGFQSTHEPVLRVGRLLSIKPDSALTTDCTLIGGDSGGPLFDLQGQVIGIHSRIGGSLTANLHVPVNIYRDTWDRLKRGEHWGHTPGSQPYIGVQGEAGSDDARIAHVLPNSPAEKAGIRIGDLIVKFANRDVRDFKSLRSYVDEQEPGTTVPLVVMRGGKRLELSVVVGRIRD